MENRIRKALSAMAAICASTALAQQAEPPAKATTADEVLTLPAFTVASSTTSEYLATESTTGTRVASKVIDQPFVVNVVTSQFMDEFNLLEFQEQFAYTSNFVGTELLWGPYNLRGFTAQLQLRNGFRRNGLSDKVNIERGEVIKGPTTSIYGITSPSGAVNFITRKPKALPEYRLSVAGGDHDFHRAELSATGPLGASGKIFYRIDGASWGREPDPIDKKVQQDTASGVVVYKPSKATSITLEYEYLQREESGISGATMPFSVGALVDPFRSLPVNFTGILGQARGLMHFNVQGPQNYSNRDVASVTGTFEHRFNDVFSFRSSANWWARSTLRHEVASRNQYIEATRTIARGTPAYRTIDEGTGGWQSDLLATFDTGPVKHKLLVTLDYARNTQTNSRQYAMTNFAVGMPGLGTTVSIDDARLFQWVPYTQDPSLYTQQLDTDLYIDGYGVFVSERAFLFDERLIVLVGGRQDYVKNKLTDNLANTTVSQNANKLTYQMGLNYKLLPWLRLYANRSTSFFPQIQAGNAVGVNPDGSTFSLPNEEGVGTDAGIKISALNGRLSLTAGWFEVERQKIAFRTTDFQTGSNVTIVSGNQRSEGAEVDFNFIANKALQFFGGYGYTEAEYVKHPFPWLIGQPLRNAPRHTLGLGTRFQVQNGALRGLYLTAGFRYNSSNPVNPEGSSRSVTATAANPVVNRPFPNGQLPVPTLPAGALITSGVVRLPNGAEVLKGLPYDVIDAGIGYSWRTGHRRLTHRIQFNVSNLLDEHYTQGAGATADFRSTSATYTLAF